MAQAATDKALKVGAATVTTLASPGKALAASSINVGATTNWPTDTGKIISIWQEQLGDDGEYEVVPGTYTEWAATHSGTTVNNLTLVYGTDQVYPAGSTTKVAIRLSAAAHNRFIDAYLTQHGQDGTHGAITATSLSSGSVTSSGDVQIRSTSLETIRSETFFDYVASGGVWTGDAYGSTRNASMTAVTCYINGRRGTITAVTARSFTASKDTYVDILNSSGTFSLVYTEVANNAASPALAANSLRLAIIVTGASNIANVGSVNQGQEYKLLPIASSVPYAVTDSLGNLICSRDPNRKTIGLRQVTAQQIGITGETDLNGMTFTVNVPSDRKIRLRVVNGSLSTTTTGDRAAIRIKEGATTLQTNYHTGLSNNGHSINDEVTFTPTSSGVHTYKVTLQRDVGAGSVGFYGASDSPGQFIAELA